MFRSVSRRPTISTVAITIVVMSTTSLIEKKDKTTNEPVQFYSANGGRTPDEVVVNEVGKDTIKGYLATPKIATARK